MLNRFLLILIAAVPILIFLLYFSSNNRTAVQPNNPSGNTPGAAPTDFAQQCAQLTSEARIKNGLSPLTWDGNLATIAKNYAIDQNNRQFRSHVDPEGRQPWDRARMQGYNFNTFGENLCWGQMTPQQALQDWLNSPGHRANIMNSNFNRIGVGVIVGKIDEWKGLYGNADNVPYWVQLFSD